MLDRHRAKAGRHPQLLAHPEHAARPRRPPRTAGAGNRCPPSRHVHPAAPARPRRAQDSRIRPTPGFRGRRVAGDHTRGVGAARRPSDRHRVRPVDLAAVRRPARGPCRGAHPGARRLRRRPVGSVRRQPAGGGTRLGGGPAEAGAGATN